jgi:hypothetical protein
MEKEKKEKKLHHPNHQQNSSIESQAGNNTYQESQHMPRPWAPRGMKCQGIIKD